ncbi:uncharacterized protein K02A2.6-like [Lineus longissimus]|uniref:uncharacterized protein K02A2.6-like n=1 Tax=Lineus longissimus TaxID=88925 RepID=UPI00315D0EFE
MTFKTLISSDSTLAYYDPKQPVTLEVDASQKGLGEALLQHGRPVAFASKALSDTQSRYSNIEREALGLVHGIERFHTYLYGRFFTAITDHKPLVMLKEKPLYRLPGRLDRMFQKIGGYNFELVYRPGSEMILSDVLSRLPNPSNNTEVKLATRVHSVAADVVPETYQDQEIEGDTINQDLVHCGIYKPQQLRDLTSSDPVLQQLSEYIWRGWPAKQHDLPAPLRQFWSYRDELAIEDGILFKGKQVVIPETLRKNILEQLHDAHQGIEKTRRLARELVYWPNINKDVEDLVSKYSTCQEYRPQDKKEPLIPHEIAKGPWMKLASDLFEVNGRMYLVLADYFTKYPIVAEMPPPVTCKKVTKEIRSACSFFGRPDEIISDNGGHYTGAEMKTFCSEWSITHTTSSPRYPQSNGFSEAMVDLVKRTIKKCTKTGKSLDVAMMNLRATPIGPGLPSPAEMMFGRRLNTLIPSHHTTTSATAQQRQQLEKKSQTMKEQYDQTALPEDLPPLLTGQIIRYYDKLSETWKPGKVIKQLEYLPRSYIIETSQGVRLRRNRCHVHAVPQAANPAIQPVATRINPGHHHVPVIPPPSDQVAFQTDASQGNDTTCPGPPSMPNGELRNASPGKVPATSNPKQVVSTRSGRAVVKPIRYRDD